MVNAIGRGRIVIFAVHEDPRRRSADRADRGLIEFSAVDRPPDGLPAPDPRGVIEAIVDGQDAPFPRSEPNRHGSVSEVCSGGTFAMWA